MRVGRATGAKRPSWPSCLAGEQAARIDSSHSIYFTLPQTQSARTAKIHIYYAFSPSLLPQLSHIQAHLERNAVCHHPAHHGPGGRLVQPGCRGRIHDSARAAGAQQRAHHPVHRTLHDDLRRPGKHHAVVPRTSQHLPRHPGRSAALADDLKQLPMPFLDPAVIQPLSIPIVFASAPSFKAIQAAGVVSATSASSPKTVRCASPCTSADPRRECDCHFG